MTGNPARLGLTELRFADGQRFLMPPGAGRTMIGHSLSLRYAAFCGAILLLTWPGQDLPSALDLLRLAALVASAVCVWLAIALLERSPSLLGRRRILRTPLLWLPPVTVAALLPLGPQAAPLPADLLRLLVLLLLLDLGFSQFIAPRLPALTRPDAAMPQDMPAPRPAPPSSPNPPTATLRIGAEAIPLHALHYIRAEDHYLRIVTAGRRHLLRGRLADAEAQLDPAQGIRINRSAWIAFDAIRDLQETDGTLTLGLPDGRTERVAQSRRIALQSALAQRRTR